MFHLCSIVHVLFLFQAFMNNYLFGTRQRFWIGLSDRNTNNGQFVWIDEVEVSYLNWAPGEPSGVSVSATF